MRLRLILGVALLTVAALPLSANLVVNPGFESGDFTGWTVTNPNVFVGVDTFNPYAGTYAAFLGTVGSDSGLSQTFTGSGPGLYNISFFLYSDGGAPNNFSLYFDGNLVTSMTNADAFAYTPFSFNATATTASPMLQFVFRQDPAFWYLDDVSATLLEAGSVPESGTMGLMFGGIGVAFFARRRCKA